MRYILNIRILDELVLKYRTSNVAYFVGAEYVIINFISKKSISEKYCLIFLEFPGVTGMIDLLEINEYKCYRRQQKINGII